MEELEEQIAELQDTAENLMLDEGSVLIGIDGRCAAGKSTLGELIAGTLDAPLIHMDDFFLRPSQRSEARYAEPGGNVDRERIRSEVIDPWLKKQPVIYQPFDCSDMSLKEPIEIPYSPIMIIEGTYSLHTYLADAYDLKVFMDISPQLQMQRLEQRETAESLQRFIKRWIPLEEAYFNSRDLRGTADLIFEDMEMAEDGE
jgi:uridine kinase